MNDMWDRAAVVGMAHIFTLNTFQQTVKLSITHDRCWWLSVLPLRRVSPASPPLSDPPPRVSPALRPRWDPGAQLEKEGFLAIRTTL